ncbi:MAG: hypothetical protein KGZ45_06705, partial [Clostridium sp.]|nr:hypothetical protein [Clostridium sp.]
PETSRLSVLIIGKLFVNFTLLFRTGQPGVATNLFLVLLFASYLLPGNAIETRRSITNSRQFA